MREIRVIGAASGWGAQDHGCQDGPMALRTAGLLDRLKHANLNVHWDADLHPMASPDQTAIVTDLCSRLADEVEEVRRAGEFPLVLGGDHSCSIGTWSGVRRTLGRHDSFGLIWVDAHMDSHTPETTPSGALHGMPLACLLGHGLPQLVNLAGSAPALSPEHVCLIGVRSYEAGEAELLRRLNVRIYMMEEVHRRGIAVVLAEALEIVRRGTTAIGVTIDLDALDPYEEPGVGTPVPDGIFGGALKDALRTLQGAPDLAAVELMEYNPYRDRGNATADMAIELALAMLADS
jgi:arginase